MLPDPALSQTRAIAFLRLPVAYVRLSVVATLVALLQLYVERLRLLRRVRVIGSGINLELGQHLPAEDVLREHPLDRLLDRKLGLPGEDVTVALLAESARNAGVPVEEFVVELV